jgi:hypothetical protein
MQLDKIPKVVDKFPRLLFSKRRYFHALNPLAQYKAASAGLPFSDRVGI